jgi:hypothetical protein
MVGPVLHFLEVLCLALVQVVAVEGLRRCVVFAEERDVAVGLTSCVVIEEVGDIVEVWYIEVRWVGEVEYIEGVSDVDEVVPLVWDVQELRHVEEGPVVRVEEFRAAEMVPVEEVSVVTNINVEKCTHSAVLPVLVLFPVDHLE